MKSKLILSLIVVSGNLLFSCVFKDQKNGKIKEFYPSGYLKSEFYYKDGKRDGLCKEFDDMGRLSCSVEYKNDKRNGKFTNWEPETGKPSLVTYFVNDTQQGPLFHYYSNGKIFRENSYDKGHINGLAKTFWPNGKPKAILEYKSGCPAIGIKEFNKDGKEIKSYPVIVVKEIDHMALLNKYIIKIYLSDRSYDVDFYEGKLTENKFFPDANYSHKLKTTNGEIVIEENVDRGAMVHKDFYITAKIKTKLGNTLYIHKFYKVFAVNS